MWQQGMDKNIIHQKSYIKRHYWKQIRPKLIKSGLLLPCNLLCGSRSFGIDSPALGYLNLSEESTPSPNESDCNDRQVCVWSYTIIILTIHRFFFIYFWTCRLYNIGALASISLCYLTLLYFLFNFASSLILYNNEGNVAVISSSLKYVCVVIVFVV